MRIHFLRLITGAAVLLMAATTAPAQMAIGFGGEPHDEDMPIEITAENLRVDEATGNAIFTGNVVVVQGELRLTAPEVQINYEGENGEQEINDVFATGGVLITRGEDAAEGAEAVYDVATSILTMQGDVLVVQGTTAISGDELVVSMDTGIGTVEGNVRTVLQTGGTQ